MQLALLSSSLLILSLNEHFSSSLLDLTSTYCRHRHPVLVHPHRPSCQPTQFVRYNYSCVYINLIVFISKGRTET
jgi:hypothetical protein